MPTALGCEGGQQDLEPTARAMCPSQVTKGFFQETVTPHPGFPKPLGSQTAGPAVNAHSTALPTVCGPNGSGF